MFDRLAKFRTCALAARASLRQGWAFSFKFGFSFGFYFYFSRGFNCDRGAISSLD